MYEPHSQEHSKVLQLLSGQYYNTLHVEEGYDHDLMFPPTPSKQHTIWNLALGNDTIKKNYKD